MEPIIVFILDRHSSIDSVFFFFEWSLFIFCFIDTECQWAGGKTDTDRRKTLDSGWKIFYWDLVELRMGDRLFWLLAGKWQLSLLTGKLAITRPVDFDLEKVYKSDRCIDGSSGWWILDVASSLRCLVFDRSYRCFLLPPLPRRMKNTRDWLIDATYSGLLPSFSVALKNRGKPSTDARQWHSQPIII